MISKTLICALGLCASLAFAATTKLDSATLSKMSDAELNKLKTSASIPGNKIGASSKAAIDEEMQRRVEAFNKENPVATVDKNKAMDEAHCVNKAPHRRNGNQADLGERNPQVGTWMPGPDCVLR